jgi:dephospho-CoA kinase
MAIKIGITGGIGSGKSTVSEVIKIMGYPVYNSDMRAAVLMQKDPEIKNKIIEIFGAEIIDENGYPDRRKIAEIVFKSVEQLNKLNSIIHPAVRQDFNNWCRRQSADVLFKESAILFEHHLEKELDFVWLVDAPEELRIARVMKRGLSRDEVLLRMERQLSPQITRERANARILNDENMALIPQIIHLLKSIDIR